MRRAYPVASRGFTLVELMVTIAIGMVIISALTILLANNSRGQAETVKTSKKIENGRYAIELLSNEIQNAGYLAELDPRALTLPASKPDPCATADASLAAALRMHVQGYNDVSASVLGCLTGVKAGTDILVVRRASGCIAGVGDCAPLAAGDVGFQASSCSGASELGSGTPSNYYRFSSTTSTLTLTKRDCATLADVRRYFLRIYYIGTDDKAGDGIPTLKRAELRGGSFVSTSLVQGVENMQIEYGLDTTGNGSVDVYTPAPDLYLGCAGSACVAQWASVVAAKISILSRNNEATGGYVDSKTYVIGHNADGANASSGTEKTVGPLSDAFRRSVFQAVARFQNPSGRSFAQ